MCVCVRVLCVEADIDSSPPFYANSAVQDQPCHVWSIMEEILRKSAPILEQLMQGMLLVILLIDNRTDQQRKGEHCG